MNRTPSAKLERYALKVHQYGRITGVALAAHAIADAQIIQHVSVGCKHKGVSQTFLHDWGRQPQRRESWTEVAETELIEGAAARIGPYVRSCFSRYRPGLIVVTSSSALELAGEDIAAAVRAAGKTVECPVRYVAGHGYDGDLFDGYAAVLEHVVRLVPWSKTKSERKHVSLVGYLFDRYEGDHAGNLAEIRGLLGELGVALDAVFLSGTPLAGLMQAARSETLIALPYAHGLKGALESSGRRVVYTGLPMGARGTARWLFDVGEALGVPERRIREIVGRLSGETSRAVAMLKDRARGGRTAVFGEMPMAVGLSDVVEGLGLSPLLVGVRAKSLGGAAEAKAALERTGVPLREDIEWLDDPGISAVRAHLAELISSERISAAVGSAGELATMPLWAPGKRRFASVIVGYPSSGYHALMPSPFMGYGGVMVLAQRILEELHRGLPEW